MRGAAYLGKGDLENAKIYLQKALSINPNYLNAKLLLTDIYLKEGNYDLVQKESLAIFIKLNKNTQVKLIIGDENVPRKSVKKGVESFNSLFELASENPAGYIRVGSRESMKKKYDQIIKHSEKILSYNPELMNVFTNIILLHALKNEFRTAFNRCDHQIKLLSKKPALAAQVYNLKGGLHLSQNELDKAEDSFNRATELNPEFLKPYYAAARLNLMNKDEDKAILQYQKILEQNPDQTAAHMMLGTIYSLKKKFDLSEQHYRAALQINPDLTQAANNLAYLLAEHSNEYDEALKLALKAREQKPDDPFIKDSLGWIYFKKGLYDKAVMLLTESAAEITDNATLHYHLGMALYKKGDKEEARKNLEKALNINDKFSEAKNARQVLTELRNRAG
ncbi:MAG: tetratricopeptide repeat protein [Deltaproteobacteria bacterium]|nr:tetratricopeptide repeat protein [Deltaproteobacteria bacterium]